MSRPTRASALAVALLGSAALSLVPPTAEHAAAVSDGSVTGTVTAPGQGDLQGVIVIVSQTVTTGTVGETTTAADGTYTISGVAPGSYYVEFDTDGATVTPAGFGYESQWSPGVEDSSQAEPIGVSSGLPTTANADMVQYGEITGKITEAETGDPAANADVQAFNPSHSKSLSAPAFTAADGTYTLQGAVPGKMVVQIEDTNDQRFYPQYVGGEFVASEGKTVAVSSGLVTTGINQAIVGRGIVEGGVSDKSTGTPLSGITVDEFDAAGKLVAAGSSNGTGGYSVYIPAGVPMRFEFGAGSSTYAPQYYKNRPSLSCADKVTVAANATKEAVSAAMTKSPSQIGKCGGGGGKGPTAAQIKSSLESQLVPKGKDATRPKIHTNSGFSYHFKSLEAGALVITWKSTAGTKLGSAKATHTSALTHTVKLTLNAAGKKAFGKGKHPHLLITGSFTPNGGKAVTASKKFSPAT